jgi:hypothetical protein
MKSKKNTMAGKPLTTLIRLMAFLLAGTLALAHGDLEQMTGTLARVSGDSITLTTAAGKTIEVLVEEGTPGQYNIHGDLAF